MIKYVHLVSNDGFNVTNLKRGHIVNWQPESKGENRMCIGGWDESQRSVALSSTIQVKSVSQPSVSPKSLLELRTQTTCPLRGIEW